MYSLTRFTYNLSGQGQVSISPLSLAGCHRHAWCITLQLSSALPISSWVPCGYIFAIGNRNHFPLRSLSFLPVALTRSLLPSASLSLELFSLASVPGGCPSGFHFCLNHLLCAFTLSPRFLLHTSLNGLKGILYEKNQREHFCFSPYLTISLQQ